MLSLNSEKILTYAVLIIIFESWRRQIIPAQDAIQWLAVLAGAYSVSRGVRKKGTPRQ